MELAEKQIYIIGAQRSGTTMLMLLLNSHSQISITREAEFLMPFMKKKYLSKKLSGRFLQAFYSNYMTSVKEDIRFSYASFTEFFSKLSPDDMLTLRDLIDGMFSLYCRNEGKSICGNKTPLFNRKIDILLKMFPNAIFINLVRDGRDVFISRRKKKFINENAVISAIDWSYKQFRAERSFKKIPSNNKITIRYEELLEEPEKVLKSLCSTIGVDFEPAMLDFYKTSRDYLVPRHSKWIFQPINKENKYKWKKELTPKEIRIFNLIAGHYLKKYSYDYVKEKLDLSIILYMIKEFITGLPHKISLIQTRKTDFDEAIRKGKLIGGEKKNFR